MNILLVLGRIAFMAIFVISGAQKLIDIPGTAAMIGPKLVVPAQLSGLAVQLEEISGTTVPHLLAIASGVIELGCGLMIIANIGTRTAAILLILFTAAATYWFHDFWNMEGADRVNNMIHTMKNLSIMGALLVLFVIGPRQPGGSADPRY